LNDYNTDFSQRSNGIWAEKVHKLHVTVKYVAIARDITRTREETIETNNSCTVRDLLGLLSEKYGQKMRDYLFDPATGQPRPHLQFLLNGRSVQTINGFETTLADDSTLLIFPPVGGG